MHRRNVFLKVHNRRLTVIALGKRFSDAQIDAAWNAMLVGMPPACKTLLRQAQQKYRLFALSNTNNIHLRHLNTFCRTEVGIEAYFDKAYFSQRLGVRKPDAAAFNIVLQANALVPARTLFIDDNASNIAAAQKLGIRTHLHTMPGELAALL